MAYEALYTRGRPKTFSQLIGQEHIVNALTRAISSNRLSHAYLLVGTRGTGKTSTARLLAKAMNCEKVLDTQKTGKTLTSNEIPCNKCASCLSIDSSPDNVEFDAASNRSVEDVTRLLSTAYLAPLQSHIKTFIIDEVHMLSFEAVNSILKLIEEPPPNVAFFLATTELNKVPMTIRSRCQVLNFRLIPQETISNYLLKLATRLKVELEEDAAKKIARLAAGSMRDAMTYLDQCYAMAEEKISLENVNETLGLISDSDLDEIISAVKSQNRSNIVASINRAFRSGLSSISIAESLITRLRDLEFETLERRNDSTFRNLDNFVDAIRKAIFEMQNSGIPDIILEMTLMKLATPQIVSTPVRQNAKLDESEKISYDINEVLKSLPGSLKFNFKHAVVRNFSDGVNLVLALPKSYASLVNEIILKDVGDFISNKFGRKIFVEVIADETLKVSKFDTVKESDISFLEDSLNIFQTEIFKKINDEE